MKRVVLPSPFSKLFKVFFEYVSQNIRNKFFENVAKNNKNNIIYIKIIIIIITKNTINQIMALTSVII